MVKLHRGTQIPGLVASPTHLQNNFWPDVFKAFARHERKEVDTWDKYLKLMRDGSFGALDDTVSNCSVSANFTFARVQIMMALLYTHDPAINTLPNEMAAGSEQSFAPLVMAGLLPTLGEAKREFALTVERMLRYSYGETNSRAHNEACLFEAIVRGLGITKTSFDAVRGIDRIDTIRRFEFYADPHARYSLEQGQYVCQSSVMPIHQARPFFEKYGVNPKKIEPNYCLNDGGDLTSKEQAADGDDQAKDLYKFIEVWNKDGDRARQLMYWNPTGHKWITPDPIEWPFQLDHDEFPYEPLAFFKQFGAVADAFTALHVVEGLRKGYEEMVESMNRQGRRAIARKVLFDKKRFSEEAVKQLKNARDQEFVGVNAADGRRVSDGLEVVDFNTDNDVAPELASAFKGISDEVMGMDELLRGGQTGNMSASEASIRDENTKMRTNKMQAVVDSWLIRQARHRAQIARQLIEPDKVGQVSGMMGSLLWALHAGNGTDLTDEYSITIQAGSTGERSKRDKIEKLAMQFEYGMQLFQMSGMPIIDCPGILKAINELGGDNDPMRFINKEMALAWSTGQMMMPQEEPNVAEEAAGGEPPPPGY